jgi:hypothetical protein
MAASLPNYRPLTENSPAPSHTGSGLYLSSFMKAILIDVTARTVTDIDINEGLQAMYAAIGCQCVDRIALDSQNDLWLDDEGLLLKPQPPKFQLVGSSNVFAGNGLICGYNRDGATIGTTYKADQIRPFVAFLGDARIERLDSLVISFL